MNLPDVAELRDLIRHMPPSERDELHRAIFGDEYDLGQLSFHELERLRYLGTKLCAAWPYCGEDFLSLSLTEMLVTLDDDEARDLLNLERWAQGDERPAEYPYNADNDHSYSEVSRALEREYRPAQPLRFAQRIINSVNASR